MIKSCACYECRTDHLWGFGNATPLAWYDNGKGVWTNRVNDKRVVFTTSGHRFFCSDKRRSTDGCPERAPFNETCRNCPRV